MEKRLPLSTRLLSYFKEVRLDKQVTPQNREMELWLSSGRLKLTTRNAIYSYEDRYKSYSLALHRLRHWLPAVEQVLILGFGLGSIAVMLERQHGLKPHIVGVDHDPLVLGWYSRYYNSANVQLEEADAGLFVQQCQARFDLICIDLFKDAQIPAKFNSPQFLLEVKGLLNQGGKVLFNRLTMEPGLATATRTYFQQTFLNVFPSGQYIDSGGNWVLVGE